MSSFDSQLVGWWKVQSIEMIAGKTLALFGGLPGDRVCFSDDGHYCVFPDDSDLQCYRCVVAQPYSELDIWMHGLEIFTSLCLYTVDDDLLRITVAGRPDGCRPQSIKRPTAMGSNDSLYWALIIMKRTKPPKKKTAASSAKHGWKLKPGRFIPECFLDD